MTALFRPAIVLLLILTLLTGVAYPLAVTGVAQLAFPSRANGSLLVGDGKAIGSTLIGQAFSDPKHFWSRPSATAPQPYNGTASGGSNLGPLNPALTGGIKSRIGALKAGDPTNNAPIPVDLVTASGSGLDPDISLAAADYQVSRVARARNMKPEDVQALLASHAQKRWLGILGESRVNVLELNRALDGSTPRP
jgi:potassium-transporting ATPase KdpC subunit